MKTAMQEAIKEIAELWSSPSDTPTYTQIFKVLESKLEKEKEQIMEAVIETSMHGESMANEQAKRYYDSNFLK